MTSYLVVRKSHLRCFNDIFYAWNVFAIDFIDEQPGTIIRIHIPSKFCSVGFRTVKFCHPMRQTWVKTSQYPCVISPNPVGHSNKVMKHSNVALSTHNLFIMHPITIPIIFISTECAGNRPGWKLYLSSRETWDPVCERHCPVRKRNLVFDYQKCQQMMLTGVAEGYRHICGGPFSPGLPQGALFTQILCNSLFRLCALSDIFAYLTRTVETETTWISIGCHSIRTALVVRWHHIRAKALR